MEYNDIKLSISKLAPTIGVGVEKALSRKYSTRFDIEYILKTDATNNSYKLERQGTICIKLGILYNTNF
jgi:hypothetical protein